MRVLHVLPTLQAGGAERLVLAHASRSPNVSVATVFGGGTLHHPGALHGERRRGRPSSAALFRLIQAARAADVVHTHLFAGDLWGGLAARLAGRPQLSHEHNVDRDESPATRATRRVIGAWPAETLAVSESAARHSFARHITVVPNGVDLERFASPWRGGGGVFAIGRRVPQKGFDVLLAALPDGTPATIVGEGEVLPDRPGVRCFDRREDVPTLLAAADVLVVPSRWEGFGLVALEGMAAGTPVIASDVDGLGELVRGAGILVPPGDVATLRSAIVAVLGDEVLRRRLSAAGRARAADFPLSATFAAWGAAYGRVVGRQG